MFRKVLVANGGEIAVRAFRAATELGAQTVAVFPHEGRKSEHVLKADEAYEIGTAGHPVRSYLDAVEITRVAVEAGADAIYPGYGFLSENPLLAEACETAGITFVGPPGEVLHLTGNKSRAIAAAQSAGLPTLRGSEPSDDVDAVLASAEEIGFPLFVKAVAGGGGRGMSDAGKTSKMGSGPRCARPSPRLATRPYSWRRPWLTHATSRCRSWPTTQATSSICTSGTLRPTPTSEGRRDGPGARPRPVLRDQMCAHAVTFARAIGYVNAGTVEFLLSPDGRYVFIEMNPRIQVEHTVTEEVTDVDLVTNQFRIASGATLPELGLTQDKIQLRGAAIQCRITTEDPAPLFRPDTGRITVYRSAGGAGARLDGGTVFVGAEIGAHFDSMLVKVTCRGGDFATAVRRSRRVLAEFRIRGVATNIPFLQSLLNEPDFVAGRPSTSFIEMHPGLLTSRVPADRGTKLLTYLAEVTVNKPYGPRLTTISPRR